MKEYFAFRIRAVIMTTVSGTNIKDIPDIIDTVVKHKADVWGRVKIIE
ncbi:hypothetical protein C808_01025 [Lachnospiraceae bacterium M18-1]|jgi:hypothetical protein|nr:hypothetical protein [uncultured Schaedlerella sp.]EOS40054.1 hypothetical protein C808_01025 [Lachnospiraceae bacterium M18-1]MCI9155300.1 hypothetical protein [Ruminococcus sp.]